MLFVNEIGSQLFLTSLMRMIIKEVGAAMERFLGDLKPGARACIERIEGGGALRRRMMDMGIVPGVEIEVIRCAPLGGPMQIKLKGYYLAMRRGECAKIKVSESSQQQNRQQLASR